MDALALFLAALQQQVSRAGAQLQCSLQRAVALYDMSKLLLKGRGPAVLVVQRAGESPLL